jgi:hypothetical protein
MLVPVLLAFVSFGDRNLNTLIDERREGTLEDEAPQSPKKKRDNNIKENLILLWNSKVKSKKSH